MHHKLKVLDLFSGIGGFSLGLERAGMETVAFCEIEDYPRKVLKKHWPDVPIYEDVRNVTRERLEADGITGISVITGGFPCQDLSTAGKQEGITETSRSGLWGQIDRLIGEIRPRYAIIENVAELLNGPNSEPGKWFGRILGDLAERGYDAEWQCIPASALNAPHVRDRMWLVSYPAGKRQSEVFERVSFFKKSEISPGTWAKRSVDKPGIQRVVNEFPDQLDRLKGLGNAVVPQIPEIIGRAIMEIENAP